MHMKSKLSSLTLNISNYFTLTTYTLPRWTRKKLRIRSSNTQYRLHHDTSIQ